jgi:hypothetical protein
MVPTMVCVPTIAHDDDVRCGKTVYTPLAGIVFTAVDPFVSATASGTQTCIIHFLYTRPLLKPVAAPSHYSWHRPSTSSSTSSAESTAEACWRKQRLFTAMHGTPPYEIQTVYLYLTYLTGTDACIDLHDDEAQAAQGRGVV